MACPGGVGGNTSTHNGTPVTGNCTVVRLNLTLSATSPPALAGATVVGSGFPWKAVNDGTNALDLFRS
jgi:hypothetical protein